MSEWYPEKEKEQVELEELVEKEIKEDNTPDYCQYVAIINGRK